MWFGYFSLILLKSSWNVVGWIFSFWGLLKLKSILGVMISQGGILDIVGWRTLVVGKATSLTVGIILRSKGLIAFSFWSKDSLYLGLKILLHRGLLGFALTLV